MADVVDVATSKHLISASALSKRARGQTAGAKTLPRFASLEVASYQICARGHPCPALAAPTLDPHGGHDGREGPLPVACQSQQLPLLRQEVQSPHAQGSSSLETDTR